MSASGAGWAPPGGPGTAATGPVRPAAGGAGAAGPDAVGAGVEAVRPVDGVRPAGERGRQPDPRSGRSGQAAGARDPGQSGPTDDHGARRLPVPAGHGGPHGAGGTVPASSGVPVAGVPVAGVPVAGVPVAGAQGRTVGVAAATALAAHTLGGGAVADGGRLSGPYAAGRLAGAADPLAGGPGWTDGDAREHGVPDRDRVAWAGAAAPAEATRVSDSYRRHGALPPIGSVSGRIFRVSI